MFTLAGCTGAGNESIKNASEAQVKKQITEGVTTNGSLIWIYQFDDTTALTPQTIGSVLFTWGLAGTKTKGTRNELVVLFDENNLVKKFNMSNSKINSGTNLFK